MNLSENIINELSKFEIIYNINIFEKNTSENNIKIFKNILKIINDCNRIKKKKILELINELKIISGENIFEKNILKIKLLQEKNIEDINNLNNVINIVSNYNIDFIAIYSNM